MEEGVEWWWEVQRERGDDASVAPPWEEIRVTQ
jgi:hypothetical protein